MGESSNLFNKKWATESLCSNDLNHDNTSAFISEFRIGLALA